MEELTEKRKKKYKIIRMIIQIIILILLIGALIYGTIKLFPVFLKIQNDLRLLSMNINNIILSVLD